MKRFCIVLVVIISCLWAWLPLVHTSQIRPVPDFDQNGVVDFSDFLLFVGKFGSKQGNENYEDRIVMAMDMWISWLTMPPET